MTDDERVVGDEDAPESASSTRHDNRKLLYGLAAALVVALIVIAGFVGYFFAKKTTESTSESASGAPATSSRSSVSATDVPALRPTVEAFDREGGALKETDTNYVASIKSVFAKYGQPGCVAIVNGIFDAFAGIGDSEGSNLSETGAVLTSVKQSGAKGEAVRRNSDGTIETQHWVFESSRWQFTCEGLFEDSSQSAPPAEVEPTTAACVPSPTIPAGWDKDCDGQIDADAPIGDAGCDTTECLLDKNGQGSQQGGPTPECASGEVRNEGGGNYSTCVNGRWNYVAPTFDPDSGDGYGPNQPLPPLCVRFPDQYKC